MAEVKTHTTDAGEMTQIFIELVMMQAQNAALCLGQITDPRLGEPQINIPAAKMFIDQLAVIRSKTKGNLNPDEQRVIDSTLEQLQVAFVHVAGGTAGFPAEEAFAPERELPAAPTPAAPAPQAAAPVAKPAVAEPAPAPAPPPEEGRKRFTKSYGP